MLAGINFHYIRTNFKQKYPSIFGVTPAQFEAQLIELFIFNPIISRCLFRRFFNLKTDKNNSITHTKYWSHNNSERGGIAPNISSRFINFLKNLINKRFLNLFGFEIKRKQSSFRLEQRSYTSSIQILLLRNDQIANFLIKFGTRYGIKFEKEELLKYI